MGADTPPETRADRVDAEMLAVSQASAALLKAVNGSDLSAVLAQWCDDGVLMPPHHPSVHGRSEIARYFERLFRQNRLKFSFSSSRVEVAGDIALERVEYSASSWSRDGGPEVQDVGKGLHVYRRQANGTWKLAMDIWNSDNPVSKLL
jgi:ketosteroid isomerase-like protein